MFKVNNKDNRTRPYFTPCSSVSIVNFEHVNADWEIYKTYMEESVLQAKRAAPDTFYPLMQCNGNIPILLKIKETFP